MDKTVRWSGAGIVLPDLARVDDQTKYPATLHAADLDRAVGAPWPGGRRPSLG